MWILFPPQESPTVSDSVLVIAGSADGRHQLGARLVEDGVAPNFVVSNPLGSRDEVGLGHCLGSEKPPSAVASWCLQPKPSKTVGEALTMGELAVEESWSSAVVVTSRLHARRVRTLFSRCTDLEIKVVYVDYVQKHSAVSEILHEVGGYVKFWITNPCGD